MIKKFLTIFKDSSDSFKGREAGEKVILLVRRHLFPLFLRLGFFFVAGLVPIIIWAVFFSYLIESGLMLPLIFVSSLWYMFLWLATFHTLTLYTLNVIIITNRRIIENEQRGLFDREVSELLFFRIQDISVHVSGVVETFLKFGSIVIQTAASERQFIFRDIPHPEKVKDTIMQMVASRHSGVRTI